MTRIPHANNPNSFSNNDPNGDTFGKLLSAPRRVQIPAYTDWWMRGARFGEIVKITPRKGRAKNGPEDPAYLVAHVKLDATGKTIRVMLDDCTEI